ncbi:hypothetical protein UT300009_29850 [Paraclostridium bifermentans]
MDKKSLAKLVGLVLIGLVIGRVSTPSCSLQAHTTLEDEISKLRKENSDLNAKVEDAKPYFEMTQTQKNELQFKLQKEQEENKAKELESKSKTLSNGHFVAGKDFDAGTYNIKVIDGLGNVYSDNMYTGGLNAIMGTDSSVAQTSYSNVKLPAGTTLTVDSVTIKLIPTN